MKQRVWTKWGGGRLMLIKEHLDKWTCQACAQEQTDKCPSYIFPMGEDNFIRICSECESKVFRIRIVSFSVLKDIVNPKRMWVDNYGEM